MNIVNYLYEKPARWMINEKIVYEKNRPQRRTGWYPTFAMPAIATHRVPWF